MKIPRQGGPGPQGEQAPKKWTRRQRRAHFFAYLTGLRAHIKGEGQGWFLRQQLSPNWGTLTEPEQDRLIDEAFLANARVLTDEFRRLIGEEEVF